MLDPRLHPIALAIMNATRAKWGLMPLEDVYQQGVQKEHSEAALAQAEAVLVYLSKTHTDERNLGYRDASAPLPCGHPKTSLVVLPARVITPESRSKDPQMTEVCGWCRDRALAYEECAGLAHAMRELPGMTPITVSEVLSMLITSIRAKKPR